MPDANRIRTPTEKALDEFDSGKPVSALVRQAHRIAALRYDYAGQVWFEFQQRELGVSIPKDDPVLLGLRGKLIALLGEQAAQDEYLRQYRRFESSRKMFDSENIHPTSVDQLEDLLDQTQRAYDDMELPAEPHTDRCCLDEARSEQFEVENCAYDRVATGHTLAGPAGSA